MLSLVSGHFPAVPGQVAVTSGVASDFGLRVGSVWRQGGAARTVVGHRAEPAESAGRVRPGGARPGSQPDPGHRAVSTGTASLPPGSRITSRPPDRRRPNVINPQTISVAGLVVGMLLIALVAVGGFTVLAQRRLAVARHARLDGRHGPARPPGRAGQRRRGRHHRRPFSGRCSAWPAGWAYRPALEQSGAPPDRHVRPAVGSDRPWRCCWAVVAAVFAASLPGQGPSPRFRL